MTPQRRALFLAAAAAGLLTLCVLAAMLLHERRKTTPSTATASNTGPDGAAIPGDLDLAPTILYAHNLRLRQGPHFMVYVRWIRGKMLRTQKGVTPSFDDPETFLLDIDKGVIHANIGDISNFLNTSSPKDAPLKDITIQPAGASITLHGTVHKIIPLPVELTGQLSPTRDNHVRFHVTKLEVLKIPLKGLLGGFHLDLADLVHTTSMPGIRIVDNDILFDTEKLLPPPHIHGRITTVQVSGPDLEVIYGGAKNDETKLSQWHNFLKLTGGTLDFGKLTMHNVDLTMIDASPDAWFDLDLVNYQQQLVNGYSRITPQAGLEIFMPDIAGTPQKNAAASTITLEWLKNRSQSLPADIAARTK